MNDDEYAFLDTNVSRSQTPFGNAFLDAPRRTIYLLQATRSVAEVIPKWNLGTRNPEGVKCE